MKRAFVLSCMFVMLAALTLRASVTMEPVEYRQGDTTLKGFIAYDSAAEGKRPGVLVVHEWWGLNDYAKTRARMLAEAGYVALALDMYGDGKSTEHPEEAGEWATAIRQNQELARARFMSAYEVLRKHARTDPERIAAIGYCFGGAVVLGVALGGADLDAVASFHGGLPQEPAAAPGGVHASILVCHGNDDGVVTDEQLATFRANLTAAKADWEINVYGDAKHGFTNPGGDGKPNPAYNEAADKRSWRALLGFLAEAFE